MEGVKDYYILQELRSMKFTAFKLKGLSFEEIKFDDPAWSGVIIWAG